MKTIHISAWVAKTALFMAILLATTTAHAQTFTTVRSFSGTDGGFSDGGLTLSAGVLYGANGGGGLSNAGTIFKVGTNGNGFTVLHHFAGGREGAQPMGRVVVSGNTLYGVTYRGGTNNGIEDGGTIYRVDTDGSNFSILRRLNSAVGDGTKPLAGLVLSGSTLCGIAPNGGASDRGVVFKISTNGTGYQNIRLFTGLADGSQPEAELNLIGTTLYGTTFYSQFGAGGETLFKIGVDGTGFTVLYTFPLTFSLRSCDRKSRLTPVGNAFYGVGWQNGASSSSIYRINTNGSGFQIVGQVPSGLRICGALAWTGAELLGAAWLGDLGSYDRLFQIKTNGTGYYALKTFGEFGFSEASLPVGDFVLSGTTIYGGALYGGASNSGTVFSLDVRPRLAIAAAGANVKLSWPNYAQDYQLEQSQALATGWSNVVAAPSDDGTNRLLTLPVSTASPALLHRLRR